ncbi:Centromere protein V [Colletotrichum shisoi]|uniref:Centromere protein V n=1 Tax=Colletotrichum shisoi TaxID=2078593 RepID=A0A5Q4BJX6_9PEZI|nr:Centromere protein V [Colletotrichum shisoi]
MSKALIEEVFSSRPTESRRAPLDVPAEDLKLYTGGCECGAVQVTLKSRPLKDIEIKEDNCSICVRANFQNGFIGVYPHQSLVTLVGKDQTQDYKFGRGFNGSPFCRICGVHCFGNLYGPPTEVVVRLPEATQAFVRKQLEIQPIKIRVLDGVDWDKIDIKWRNEGTEGYFLED